ncbi:MAG TPA: hypothetical protein VMW92_05560 [Candidatus Heimdallarchaeota archaeon]|nr:hypothetical protein [Candidatus Heimdallarchaeota archaeon]
MKEQEKLDEAKYFYQRMLAEQYNPLHFKYKLSAFLSASRSVLQYVFKEVKVKPKGLIWYQKAVKNSPVIKFCRDKRNSNIHYSPVDPDIKFTLQLDDCLIPSTADHLTLNGQPQAERPPSQVAVREKELKPPAPPPEYKFDKWLGLDDVPTLCRKYLSELEQFIKKGKSLGYISG